MPQNVAHDLFEPADLALARSGELSARVDEAWRRMRCCDLCARHCQNWEISHKGVGAPGYRGGARSRNPSGARLVASMTSLMSRCSDHVGELRFAASRQKASIAAPSAA